MSIPAKKRYPHTGDRQTVYLGAVVRSPAYPLGPIRCTTISCMIQPILRKIMCYTTTPSITIVSLSANFAPLPAAQSFSLQAPITQENPCPPIPFHCFLRNEAFPSQKSPLHGTTREISSSAAAYGSDTKRSFVRCPYRQWGDYRDESGRHQGRRALIPSWGVPAKPIRRRFDQAAADQLEALALVGSAV